MIWFNHDNAKHMLGTVYSNTYRLESLYYWYMQYYFQILTRQNKCFDLNILNITHIGYSVNKNS